VWYAEVVVEVTTAEMAVVAAVVPWLLSSMHCY
jgi:hypothetical protein